jgi:hypothetical protein
MESISRFLTEEQDESAVKNILPKISELLTKDEAMEYVAIQKKLVMNISPDAVVLTDRRFIVVQPSLFGMKFHDVPWRDVQDVHMSEQMVGATITCRTTTGRLLSLDSIPKKQARKIYSYAQQVEEHAYEKRQQVELEKIRAGAGGVVIQSPRIPGGDVATAANQVSEDPFEVLAKLKRLRDAELITEDEFNAKKAEVLARM